MKSSSLLRIETLAATVIVCALVVPDLLWPRQSRPVPDHLNLPSDLAKYKEWAALLQSPTPVPLELWLRCMAPAPADWAQAREKHGPHAEHYIQVYANSIATQTFGKGKGRFFPTGAVIVKEKLMNSPEGTVAGLAVMIKRGTPQFASTGGWEFAYYPRPGESASLQACADCHLSAAPKDCIFGQYPSPSDPSSTQARPR